MIFIWLLLHGFGRNVLQAANGFLICTQLDVAGCLVLQMKKALYVGQDENVSNGVSEDLSPDTRQSSSTGPVTFFGFQEGRSRQGLPSRVTV